MVTKLDRLTRSVRDFGDLLEWCRRSGKNVVSLDGEVNTDTSAGWLHVQIVMTFAEFERRRMSERRADAARKLYSNGGYNGGGSLSWGYRAVRQNGHIELVPDDELKPIIEEAVDAVLAGDSVKTVASRYGFDHASLLRRLRKPSLKGIITLHGEIVRDTEGLAKLREPVIEPKKWARLQARLDANSKGAGVPRDASPWLHVLKCWTCGEDLYLQRYSSRPNRYYHHKSLKQYKKEGIETCSARLNGCAVEEQIEPLVLITFGDSYIPEIVELAAEDHSDELAAVDEAIDAWEAKAIAGEAADSVARILDGLHNKRQALAALPQVPARKELVLSDERFADRWHGLDNDRDRGALLRRMGVSIYAEPRGRGRARLILRQGPGGRDWHQSSGKIPA